MQVVAHVFHRVTTNGLVIASYLVAFPALLAVGWAADLPLLSAVTKKSH